MDALDEAVQDAAWYTTIADLLSSTDDLPTQVRFILTARSDNEVLRCFEHKAAFHLVIDASCQENLADAQTYICHQLTASVELQASLNTQEICPDDFVNRIANASHGNFLYLVWSLSAMRSGRQRLRSLETLPEGLGGVYREFLRTRKVGKSVEKWRNSYRPLLGVLVVAKDSLTSENLQQFTRLTEQETADFLLDVDQFLDPTLTRSRRYRLYHQSVADFLRNKEQAQEFWIDTIQCHEQIADYYLGDSARWLDEEDGYAMRYLGHHLTECRRVEDLHRMLESRDWYHANLRYDLSASTLTYDLNLAIGLVERQGVSGLPRLVAYSLFAATLNTSFMRIPSDVLRVMAGTDETSHAFQIALQIQTPLHRFDAFLAIAEALSAKRERDRAIIAVDFGLTALEEFSDDYEGGKSSRIGHLVDVLVELQHLDGMRKVYRLVREDSSDHWLEFRGKVGILSRIAQGLAEIGKKEEALEIANDAEEWDKAIILISIAEGILPNRDAGLKNLIDRTMRKKSGPHMGTKGKGDRKEAVQKYLQILVAYGELDKAARLLDIFDTPFEWAKAVCLMVRRAEDQEWGRSLLHSTLRALDGIQESGSYRISTINTSAGIRQYKEPSQVELVLMEAVISLTEMNEIFAALMLALQIGNTTFREVAVMWVVREIASLDTTKQTIDISAVFYQFLSELAPENLLEGEIENGWLDQFPFSQEFLSSILLEMSVTLATVGQKDAAHSLLELGLAMCQLDELDSRSAAHLSTRINACWKLGEYHRARSFLEKLLAKTREPVDADAKIMALAELAKELARSGNDRQSFAILEDIIAWENKQSLFTEQSFVNLVASTMLKDLLTELNGKLVATLVYLDALERALEIAHAVSLFDGRKALYGEMAVAFAHKGCYGKVMELAEDAAGMIPFGPFEYRTNLEIVKTMAVRNEFETAIKFVDKGHAPSQGWPLHEVIAEEMFRAGKRENANMLFEQAAKATSNPAQLLHLARGMVRVGAKEQVAPILTHLQDVLDDEDPANLAYLCEMLFKTDQDTAAQETLNKAKIRLDQLSREKFPELLSGGLQKARMLAAIAVAADRLGKHSDSDMLFDQAIASAESVLMCNPGDRQLTWQYLAACFAEVGKLDQAFLSANRLAMLFLIN